MSRIKPPVERGMMHQLREVEFVHAREWAEVNLEGLLWKTKSGYDESSETTKAEETLHCKIMF